MNEYRISKSAILASVLDKIGFYCMAESKEEKQMATTALEVILGVLIPDSISNDEDKATATVVAMAARVVDLLELEGRALQMIKGKIDDAEFKSLIIMELPVKKDMDFLNSFTPKILPMMIIAGLKSVEGSFDELDTLAEKTEVGK